jgi:hypothetical protein
LPQTFKSRTPENVTLQKLQSLTKNIKNPHRFNRLFKQEFHASFFFAGKLRFPSPKRTCIRCWIKEERTNAQKAVRKSSLKAGE